MAAVHRGANPVPPASPLAGVVWGRGSLSGRIILRAGICRPEGGGTAESARHSPGAYTGTQQIHLPGAVRAGGLCRQTWV